MSRQKRGVLAVLVMLFVLLAGCGQKGPLYREVPEEDEQARSAFPQQLPMREFG